MLIENTRTYKKEVMHLPPAPITARDTAAKQQAFPRLRLRPWAWLPVVLLPLLAACTSLAPSIPAPQSAPVTSTLPVVPEAASGFHEKQPVLARKFMVATANPLATEAGYQIVRAGGSAVDAAIAVQMVLTLVEPQSSGIGGGAFLLHYDGKQVLAYDGRETAPAAATEELFQAASGQPLDFYQAVVGGRSVGVPGVVRMLELAHQQQGRMPWVQLFAPAIRLAEEGFAVSPRLALLLARDEYLKQDPIAVAYFHDEQGRPWPAGHVLKNPALATSLRAIAQEGANAFYQGKVAQEMVRKVNNHLSNPGRLSLADLAAYRAKVRQPVCTVYRLWEVCGMPPPSSGGITVAQMLGMLAQHELTALPPKDGVPQTEAIHLFAEAERLAFADRKRYVADPDFAPLPGGSPQALLDPAYLQRRSALIGARAMSQAKPGQPLSATAMQEVAYADGEALELPSTSHISIVDAAGNAVAMTTSIENAFGARQMVGGFLLNNQLTDFSFIPADANGLVANRVEGGKRPRSSMAPTLVFDKEGRVLQMVLGSPGGSAIIHYVAKVLIGTMDWGLNVQQAIDLPNFGAREGPLELEEGRFSPAVMEALRQRGHTVHLAPQTSGLQGIMRMRVHGEPWWLGGADPRREGLAKGD